MDMPLRILHLEDEPDFSALVSALLQKEGLLAEMVLATNYAKFTSALETDNFDVILADYLLPSCNGVQALEVARQKRPEIPFLLVSGAIGEHAAIEILRGGATDYVLKSNLERLAPSIRRAVLEVRERGQRKQAEDEVRTGEKRSRLIFDQNPVPMWVSDPRTHAILEANEAAARHYGYSRDDFLSVSTRDICSEQEMAALAEYLTTAAGGAAETDVGHAGLCRHRRKDGTLMEVEVTWSLIAFQGHECVLTMANDLTELGRAAEALRRSEASLAAAQRIAQLGSWELDLLDPEHLDRNPLRWSDETYRIFGLEPPQAPVTLELFFAAVHPEDRKRIEEVVLQAFLHREPYDLEHRIRRPGGEERVVRERAEFAFDAGGQPVQMRGVILDITERKQLEAQLRQWQKMEAIGQLAGGVAHDFNNILTVTHGHALMLLAEKTISKTGRESAQQIAQAAERAAGLTRPLLALSRHQAMEPRRLDLNEVVNNMTLMLGRILGEDIVLQPRYSAQPAPIRADISMVEQVLLNLAVNARDAMPKGGRLAIEVSAEEIGPEHQKRHPESRAGKFVCLAMIDSGAGIAPKNLPHIFEPFFTTKEAGKRTGLGLSTVYGIVKQHQGWIEVASELDSGTSFRVYLPLSKEKESPADKKPSKQPVRGGSETILVVEDESAVRELVCRLLTGYGYEVLSAESGLKALDVWRRNKQKIDLLLTDLIMPDGLNGRELAEKLRKSRPKLKVIFSSGYSADVVGKDFSSQRGLPFLQKPYDLHRLARTVRSCLDAA